MNTTSLRSPETVGFTDATSIQRSAPQVMRAAGAALIAGSLAFVAVFTYLAATFGYPDVLDRKAAEVLPLLAAGGLKLRLVWFAYGALPLVFVFAGVASGRILDRHAPAFRTLGVGAAVLAGFAMTTGLLRWPTIEWALAQHWQEAPSVDHGALSAVFDASNLFLGNLLGEFVGEVCVAIWFLTLAVAWWRQGRRFGAGGGIAVAVVMAVGALRNATHWVEPVAQVSNLALPVWLVFVGGALRRDASPLATNECRD